MLKHADRVSCGNIHGFSVTPAVFKDIDVLILWLLKTDFRLLQLIALPEGFEIHHGQNLAQSILKAHEVR